VVLGADPVQQPLIVFIAENPVPEVEGEFVLELVYLFAVIRRESMGMKS